MKKLPVRPLPNSLHHHLSAPVLLSQARKAFEKIPDPRRYGQKFSLPDVLMSGLAVFGLKYPSLLKFDEQRHEARIRANLKSLELFINNFTVIYQCVIVNSDFSFPSDSTT